MVQKRLYKRSKIRSGTWTLWLITRWLMIRLHIELHDQRRASLSGAELAENCWTAGIPAFHAASSWSHVQAPGGLHPLEY
jgi:hypothetical protein